VFRVNGWIKVCGITTAEAVTAAAEAGADAVGFVFAPSPRRITPTRAAELALPVRQKLTCVAVMQHPAQSEVDEVVREFHPHLLQTDIEDFPRLHLPQRVSRLPVLRAARAAGGYPPRLLYEGARSGSGEVSDWQQAADIARHTRLVLAGGLHPGNVADAIRVVRPFGVDASSGLESRPGVKDTGKITAFVRAARAAFSEIEA
jgi:phosphoribosylanthranilate isomerase